MSARYLVAISIGPVQTFISAARRTRDLWAGSDILSSLAAAAAVALRDQLNADVIFPSVSAGGAGNATNKLLAGLTVANPGAALRSVEDAIRTRLSAHAAACCEALRKNDVDAAVDKVRFADQVGRALDIHWAWVAWPAELAYPAAYQELQELLDARKQTRNFAPINDKVEASTTVRRGMQRRAARISAPALSSLDGREESVLIPASPVAARLRDIFQVNENEALDATGLVKRVNGGGKGFPSVTRVALQPWLEGLDAAAMPELESAVGALVGRPHQLARRFEAPPEFPRSGGSVQPNPLHGFRLDCEVLLSSRRRELARDNPDARDLLRQLGELLKDIPGAPGDALYVCALVADGDRMGKLLHHEQMDPAAHKAVSHALAMFASDAYATLAAHGGACVYAGGDDVLALCPVDTALAAARALADGFAAAMRAAIPAPVLADGEPSLSVGLGIAHVLHPLGSLRELASQACLLAKEGSDGLGLRNALGIVLAPRGGATVSIAGRWDHVYADVANGSVKGLDQALALWRDAFSSGQLAQGAPYDLAQLARRGEAALAVDAKRLIQRRVADTAHELLVAALTAQLGGDGSTRDRLRRLEAQWYVGRWLAGHAVKRRSAPMAVPPAKALEAR